MRVLDGTHVIHLATGLDCHHKDHATYVWPALEEIKLPDRFVGMPFGNLSLDEFMFSEYIRIVYVAICVKFG